MISVRSPYVAPIACRRCPRTRVGFGPALDPFFDLILLPVVLVGAIYLAVR